MGLDDLNESLMGRISAKSLHEQTGGNLPPWALETYAKAGPVPSSPWFFTENRLGRQPVCPSFPSPSSSCQRRLRCEIFGSRSPEMTWDFNGI